MASHCTTRADVELTMDDTQLFPEMKKVSYERLNKSQRVALATLLFK